MKAQKNQGTSYSNKSPEPRKKRKQETKAYNGTSNAQNREKRNRETKTDVGIINTEKQKKETTAETGTSSAKKHEKQEQETLTEDMQKRSQESVMKNDTNNSQQRLASEVEESCILEKRDEFVVGDFVLLSTDDIDLALGEKAPTVTPYRLVGPFIISARISETSFKVGVPRSMGIDGIFNSSKLVSFMKKERLAESAKEQDSEKVPPREQQSVSKTATTTTTTTMEEHSKKSERPPLDHEVEEVLDERVQQYEGGKRRLEYLVKWKGCSASEATWEPRTHLRHVSKLLNEYLKTKKHDLQKLA